MTIAVMGFFALAGISWLTGCPTFTCAMRGLLGGLALFAVATVAGRILTGVLADAIASRMAQGGGHRGTTRDDAS